MDSIHPKHKEFLFKLIDTDVSFLLIGGYAVIYHGYARMTNDVDVWLKPDNENKAKFIEVLKSEDITDEGIEGISQFDFTKPQVFFMGEVPLKFDFLTVVQGLKYDTAFNNRVSISVEGKHIPCLCLNDLVISKMISGRPKDLADLDELQKINRLKK